MTMTKQELITLIREDMRYQRHELEAVQGGIIKINGVTYYHTPTLKLRLNKQYLEICFKQNGVRYAVAHIFFDDINSIGYHYSNRVKIARRLEEIRLNSQCSREM